MSADLFAIFGTTDSAPAQHEPEDRWSFPQGGPQGGFVVAAALEPHQLTPRTGNIDILFDADETEAKAEDDFGDFEDVETTRNEKLEPKPTEKRLPDLPSLASISREVDLLDLGIAAAAEPVQEHRRSASQEAMDGATTVDEADEWGDFQISPQDTQPEPRSWKSSRAVYDSIEATALAPDTNIPSRQDDNWDEFEDWNSEPPLTQDLSNEHASTDPPHPPAELPNEPRPSNIPPPVILLQILPEVFQSLQSLAKTSTPSTSNSLATSIIRVFTVSARLLAGRLLRPKRDTYLSQSLRIGPSIPGSRSGGMKLTSLNKAEALHSEREAASVCDAWSSSTHVFAGIVSQSEHRRPWMHLNVNMVVRAGPGYGTLEAREACVLCGIRRDERIAGVDFEADDVFGEYWTDGWGHVDCRVFWYSYREILVHRY